MVRVGFDGGYVSRELRKVGNALTTPVNLYLIGGAAMIRYGLKAATKDIDVLFSTHEEAVELVRALGKSGYHPVQKAGLRPTIRRCSQHRYLKTRMDSDGTFFMNSCAEN